MLRKILNDRARVRILRAQGIAIDSSAKVNYRGIGGEAFASLRIGAGTIVEGSLTADRAGARIAIGRNTFLGVSKIICAHEIEVGDDVLVSWGCCIVDHDSHSAAWVRRKDDVRNWYSGKKDWSHVRTARVSIANKVWIGFNSIVLKGVEIGEGSIVGAGSVVTRSIPPYVIAAGNPARVVREISGDE